MVMQVINNRGKQGRIWGGLFLTGIGGILLLKQFGVPFPYWFFTWPVFLIALGSFIGLKHGFRGPAWAILILIGSVFLIDIIEPDLNLKKFALPITFIAFGLMMLFRSKRPYEASEWRQEWRRKAEAFKSEQELFEKEVQSQTPYRGENFLDSVTQVDL